MGDQRNIEIEGADEDLRALVRLDPRRWREADARIRLLNDASSTDALLIAADQLGLSLNRVRQLARGLRSNSIDETMPGWAPRSRRLPDRLHPDVVAAIDEVLTTRVRRGVKASAVIREIGARCQSQGLKAPSPLTISRRLGQHIDGIHVGGAFAPGLRPIQALVVDRVALSLAMVENADLDPTLPLVSVVTDEATGAVMAAALACDDDWAAQAMKVLGRGLAYTTVLGANRLPATVQTERGVSRSEWVDLAEALESEGTKLLLAHARHPASGRLHIHSAGRALAGITVLSGPFAGKEARERRHVAAARMGIEPFGQDEVVRMIGAAIEVHNERRLATIKDHLASAANATLPSDADRLSNVIERLEALS